MWRCVGLVRTDVSEERVACIVWVEKIRWLRKALAVANRLMLTANPFFFSHGYVYTNLRYVGRAK
jgi:hypothetical protein